MHLDQELDAQGRTARRSVGPQRDPPRLLTLPEGLRSARVGVSATAVIGVVLVVVVALAVLGVRAWQAHHQAVPQPLFAGSAAIAGDGLHAAGTASDAEVGTPTSGVAQTEQPAAESGGSEGVSPSGPLMVHVTGAVRDPGVVEVTAGARVQDAVDAAGGLGADADTARINLARVVTDGELIWVPRPDEEPPEPVPSSGGAPAVAGALVADGESVAGGPGAGLIDLNTADQTGLEQLPGVGPVTAQSILAWREDNGAFTSAEELLEVRGIGPATLDRLRPHLTW